MMSKILIVEDDENIISILKYILDKEGFSLSFATDGEKGLSLSLKEDFDIILLDVMLPFMNGFDILKGLREKKTTPVIMLTAMDDEDSKVRGFELGANDYVSKPFSNRELIARINANIRKAPPKSDRLLLKENLFFDFKNSEIILNGEKIPLTARENLLLDLFSKNPSRVFSREELLKKIWGYEEYIGDTRGVDVTIKRLRAKMENFDIIKTRRGAGYYLDLE
ncbi:MAG: response regulator transcription factor [Clostridia bacterium]|nr:response regulator transcription factor [Clostridia bacterium]